MGRIRAGKDFYAGLLYMLFALAFLWFGRDYEMGAASRMGPGYFPTVLGWILFGIGAASTARSFLVDGEPVDGFALKKLTVVTAAIVAFGALLPYAGLAIGLSALAIISASASAQTRWDWRSALALLALAAFCSLVFVKGLGVPMPIFGSWFDGLVPPAWQR